MKKALQVALIGPLVVVLAASGFIVWAGSTKQSVPGPDALRALELIKSNTAVEVDYGDWFVIRPAAVLPAAGLIIYPGAHSAVRGYVNVMTRVAEAGYLVVTPKMPLGYAFLAPDRAEDIYAAYPEIKHWFLAGHSLGGAMAGRYAHNNGDKLSGLIFLDSYPPESSSLEDSSVPTLLIHRAKPDGELPQIYKVKKSLYPPSAEWVPVLGGDHGQFGDNVGGMYQELDTVFAMLEGLRKEAWEATISREEQQAIVSAAIVDWIGRTLDAQANPRPAS